MFELSAEDALIWTFWENMYTAVEAGVNMTYWVTEYFVKGHTSVMHVSNREREKGVSISRTVNER
jgi:hypothetical protein